MRATELYSIFDSLTPEEIQRFRLYLSSPYFTTDSSFISLLDCFCLLLAEEEKVLYPEQIFERVFGDKPFDNSVLEEHVKKLLVLAKNFIVTEGIEKRKYIHQQILLEELSERDLKKVFTKSQKEIQQELEEEPLSLNLYYNKYRFEYMAHEFKQLNQKKVKEKDFQSILSAFDAFLILKKISFEVEKIAYENVYNFTLKSAFLEQLDALMEISPFKEDKLIQLYYLSLSMYKNPKDNDDVFYRIKELLVAEQSHLGKRELKELITIAVNYSNRQISSGKSVFLKESLHLYDLMGKNNVLFNSKFNRFSSFRNAVAAACRVGDFEWADRFIKDSVKQLDEDLRDATYHFGLGYYYFYQKDYQKSTEYFNQAYQISDAITYYGIDHKYMYMRSIYESDTTYTEHSISTFEIFKNWIKRQKRKIAEERSLAYANSVDILQKLYVIKHDTDLPKYENWQKLRQVKQELDELKFIMAKDWYIKKINELDEVLK